MKNRIAEAFKDKIALFLGIWIFFISSITIYTYIVSLSNPIRIVNSPTQPIEAKAGDTVVICRGVEYTPRFFSNSIEFTLSRALTLKEGGEQHTISFASFDIIRKSGAKVICRDIVLPKEMKSGLWTAQTFIKVYTTPWWNKTFEIPEFKIRVSK